MMFWEPYGYGYSTPTDRVISSPRKHTDRKKKKKRKMIKTSRAINR